MRILFYGSGEFAVPTLRSILGDGHEIVTVVTQPDRVSGRGKKLTPTPLKQAAIEAGVPVVSPEDVNAPNVVDHLLGLNADLAYAVAFGQMIRKPLREACPAGIINLHASLLPAWRGAGPIQWAVINGDRQTGVTVFRIVRKMDAGPILVQRRTAIGIDETADELHDRLARIGCDAVRATLEILEADPTTPGTPQDPSKVTLAPKLSKANGFIRFDRPTGALASKINGLWSWPGASCRFCSADGKRDEKVTIARAVPYEGQTQAADSPDAIGRVTEMMSVQTADGELALLQIKPANGKRMNWQDFVNGRHVCPGDRFLPIE